MKHSLRTTLLPALLLLVTLTGCPLQDSDDDSGESGASSSSSGSSSGDSSSTSTTSP